VTDVWRYACPECGSRQVKRRGGVQGDEDPSDWACLRSGCYARFDRPTDLKAQ